MHDNWDTIFARVLRHEGGYVDHPKDPGGATNLGVTQATLARYTGRKVTKADVRALTPAVVKPIYHSMYWQPVGGPILPGGLDYAVYDFGVNSGPRRALEFLQDALNRVLRLDVPLVVDGALGQLTKAAIMALATKPDLVDDVIRDICDRRLAWLKRLRHWPTFGKGWGRRVAAVRAQAVTMSESTTVDDAPDYVPDKHGETPNAGRVPQAEAPTKTPEGKGLLAIIGSVLTAIAATVAGFDPAVQLLIVSVLLVAAGGIGWGLFHRFGDRLAGKLGERLG